MFDFSNNMLHCIILLPKFHENGKERYSGSGYCHGRRGKSGDGYGSGFERIGNWYYDYYNGSDIISFYDEY